MELRIFRAYWGAQDGLMETATAALEAGFDGFESPAPVDERGYREVAEVRARTGLLWNAEICTGGDYVPDRCLGPEAHLDDLRRSIQHLKSLDPVRINCITGLDAWPLDVAIRFHRMAMELGAAHDLPLLFETHRSRPMFNPWVTESLLDALPDIRLTADISHWCVVAERLMDTETASIDTMAAHVRHIHARVGYDQGPQVPHPAAAEYSAALKSHLDCWEKFWSAQRAAGEDMITMTPEFGVDGYLHHLPFTNVPVADLWSINQWMAETLRTRFHRWRKMASLQAPD